MDAITLDDIVLGGHSGIVPDDSAETFYEINLRMYELGDKYCFRALKCHALNELRTFDPIYLLGVVEDYCLYHISCHPELKEVVAEAIFEAYNKLKFSQGTEKWNAGIGG